MNVPSIKDHNIMIKYCGEKGKNELVIRISGKKGMKKTPCKIS